MRSWYTAVGASAFTGTFWANLTGVRAEGDDDGPLLHFSEDPGIERFVPHVPATNPDHPPAVWAIDAAHAPLYWFPRDCPRVTVWADDQDQEATLHAVFATSARRVHAAEAGWQARIRTTELFEYALPRATFHRWEAAHGQWISSAVVTPLAVRPVGDLIARHSAAGIELRLVADLWPLHDLVVDAGLPFSMVRMHNARPRGTLGR
jgi:hypothetical protein